MREINGAKIEWQETLWKYFRTERFISALETSQIHFASANQFVDRFEGAVAVQMDAARADPRYAEMEQAEKAFFELKRLTKISCWHRAEYESDAMWKLYAEENKGISICTTPDRLRRALRPFRLRADYGIEELWAGPVEYLDLTQIRMKPGMLDRFFKKHRAFEWEREFRLVISLRTAEEFAVEVPKDGILVDVDLNILIEKIVIGATISDVERNIITKQAQQIGLGDRLQLSSMLGRPRYI